MIFICGSLSCHDVTLNDRVKIMLSLLSWRIKAIYVYWSAVPPAEQPIGSRGQRFGFFEQKKKVAHCALKMWIFLTCTVRATCFYHHPPLYPVALFAWRRVDAPVVDADCDWCVRACSRTLHRWRNCQESVIRSERVTLWRRRNMKYYKPLFCLITSESLALKCSSCGLWHVLWEAHSCGTSLNFIS